MTSKTDYSPVLIGTASQQTVGAFLIGSTMDLVTREARDLALERGELGVGWVRGNIIYWMMIFLVVMALETGCRGINARGKERTTRLGFSGRMTLLAGRMCFFVCRLRRVHPC
jgi:hypothetical protein